MIISEVTELAKIVERRQAAGQKLVFTNGVFDLLHVGHVRYLREARALGDALIVAVNSDDSVRRLKGPTRPIVGENERMEIIDALRCVDFVIGFSSQTPVALIEVVKPALYVKGGDYTIEKLPETSVVRAYGGDVRVLGFIPGRSTSNIVETIANSGPKSVC